MGWISTWMAEGSDRYLRRHTEGSTAKVLAKEAREAKKQTGKPEKARMEEGRTKKGKAD
jgi:hypothetical protein